MIVGFEPRLVSDPVPHRYPAAGFGTEYYDLVSLLARESRGFLLDLSLVSGWPFGDRWGQTTIRHQGDLNECSNPATDQSEWFRQGEGTGQDKGHRLSPELWGKFRNL